MSTKSSRRSKNVYETPKSKDSQSTPSKARMSPLSPTRISRLQEKADLQNLNDRLAAYIGKVQQLELENNRLNVQVETIQESVKKEVVSMKSIYESELQDARKLLDETAREKASLQIECGKLRTENDELRMKNAKKERDLQNAEKGLSTAQGQVDLLSGRVNALENEKKKLLAELRDLKDEVSKLTRQLAEAKQQLESETLMRVDLENRCQSLKEELAFKTQIYEKEITETKSKKQVEISEIDGRLHEEYENKMQEALQELRNQYEDELANNRKEVENLYETKLEDLNRRLSRGVTDQDQVNKMWKDARNRTTELTSRVSYLENSNSTLQQRCNDLEQQLDNERDSHRTENEALKDELELLREQMNAQLLEYQDLMDIKIALDMEIAAYRKLLESEESRLNLTPGGSEKKRSTIPVRGGVKRKRIEEETKTDEFKASSRSSGEICITEEDPKGVFIRIESKSPKDMPIGGYTLVRKAGNEEVSYKFHRQLKIPSKSVITVWSSDSDQVHDAPHNLLMKNQKWPVADFMSTQLINSDGDEIASSEAKRQHEFYSTTRRPTGLQGEEGEKCSIM